MSILKQRIFNNLRYKIVLKYKIVVLLQIVTNNYFVCYTVLSLPCRLNGLAYFACSISVMHDYILDANVLDCEIRYFFCDSTSQKIPLFLELKAIKLGAEIRGL